MVALTLLPVNMQFTRRNNAAVQADLFRPSRLLDLRLDNCLGLSWLQAFI